MPLHCRLQENRILLRVKIEHGRRCAFHERFVGDSVAGGREQAHLQAIPFPDRYTSSDDGGGRVTIAGDTIQLRGVGDGFVVACESRIRHGEGQIESPCTLQHVVKQSAGIDGGRGEKVWELQANVDVAVGIARCAGQTVDGVILEPSQHHGLPHHEWVVVRNGQRGGGLVGLTDRHIGDGVPVVLRGELEQCVVSAYTLGVLGKSNLGPGRGQEVVPGDVDGAGGAGQGGVPLVGEGAARVGVVLLLRQQRQGRRPPRAVRLLEGSVRPRAHAHHVVAHGGIGGIHVDGPLHHRRVHGVGHVVPAGYGRAEPSGGAAVAPEEGGVSGDQAPELHGDDLHRKLLHIIEAPRPGHQPQRDGLAEPLDLRRRRLRRHDHRVGHRRLVQGPGDGSGGHGDAAGDHHPGGHITTGGVGVSPRRALDLRAVLPAAVTHPVLLPHSLRRNPDPRPRHLRGALRRRLGAADGVVHTLPPPGALVGHRLVKSRVAHPGGARGVVVLVPGDHAHGAYAGEAGDGLGDGVVAACGGTHVLDDLHPLPGGGREGHPLQRQREWLRRVRHRRDPLHAQARPPRGPPHKRRPVHHLLPVPFGGLLEGLLHQVAELGLGPAGLVVLMELVGPAPLVHVVQAELGAVAGGGHVQGRGPGAGDGGGVRAVDL
mmetsp:Transcript_8502/g.21292  ORF Transcript_8502/g.21292 Transcript_8502/m.21292 type:complete len:656 (-) Transcript_8502:1622-3589(-)